MRRDWLYGLSGTLLALGAPCGLLALRACEAGRRPGPGWIRYEIGRDPSLFLYLLASTALVFTLFGLTLGRKADRLSELSISDPLTGLPNARALASRLAEACARASRYASPLSLLLIDVDGLKEVNDDAGHSKGDQALKLVAEAMRSGSRAADSLSRWGGDEFAVIAPNTGATQARHLAERIRTLVSDAAAARPNGALPITVSIGVATSPSRDEPPTPERLRNSADAALYRAKQDGRNCVRAARSGEAIDRRAG